MVLFSVVAYVVIVVWYFLGNEKNQRISSGVGTCLSSFFAFWYWGVSNIATIIYLAMGIVCVFFHWIFTDSVKETPLVKRKNKYVAAILALLLGGVGAHRFYLRRSASGLIYILFSWSGILGVVAIIEAIRLFAMKESRFNLLYNKVGSTQQAEKNGKVSKQAGQAQVKDRFEPSLDEDDSPLAETNERNGDSLNYRNISVCGYKADVTGTVEAFSIKIKANGSTYTFKAKDGDICAYRSSDMRATKHYEVM